MSERRRSGLGRGLGALIPSSASVAGDEETVTPSESTLAAADRVSKAASDKNKAAATQKKQASATSSRKTPVSSSGAHSGASGSDSSKKSGNSTKAAQKESKKAAGRVADSSSSAKGSQGDSGKLESSPAEAHHSTSDVSRETRRRTPRSKAGRPVDFFFTPGRTEEEPAPSEEVSSSGINLDRLRGSKQKPTARKKSLRGPAGQASHGEATAESAAAAAVGSGEGPESVENEPQGGKPGRNRVDGKKAAESPSEGVAEHPSPSSSREPAQEPSKMDSPDADAANSLMPVPGTTFAEIPVASIRPNSKQPRSNFDEEEMDELIHSIREIGILQPVVVRPDESGVADYELVMGERRWRATQQAGLERIPGIIRQTTDDNLLRDALLENLHRSQLNPLEEAAAYQQLLNEFGCTQEELSQRIGRSRPQISNTIRLMKLPPIVQLKVAAGTISAGHARALLGMRDPSQVVELAQRIVNEGLSVRATEELVSQQDALRQPDANKKQKRETPRHERLDYLANSLSDRLDTNVKITLGARKGKVQIDFASVEDLNRIMDLISHE